MFHESPSEIPRQTRPISPTLRRNELQSSLENFQNMNHPVEVAEEWLSTQVEGLQKTLAKATAGLVTLAGPVILAMSGLSTANKILASGIWVSMLGNLLLLALVCSHRVVNRRRLADRSTTSDPKAFDMSELESQVLMMAHNHYPERHTRDGLLQLLGESQVDLDYALSRLVKNHYLSRPQGGLWREGGPNPKGFGILLSGIEYCKKKRSEQGVGEQPAISTSNS